MFTRKIVFSLLICLTACLSITFAIQAQEITGETEELRKEEKVLQGFDLLRQFEGTWKTSSKSSADGSTVEGTVSGRAVGNKWMVIEHKAKMSGIDFEAVQTVGFDAKKKKYVGTWVDSMMDHTWKYNGSIDAGGKKLMLEAEGPDWNDPTKTKLYRDVYEFKSDDEIATTSQIQNDGEWETFMTGSMTKKESKKVNSKVPPITPFLMFIGKAEPAIEFYKTVFPNTEIESMEKYKEGEPGKAGTIKLANVLIEGQRVKFTDSPPVHDFTFTPSFSFFVECKDEAELKERFAKLSDGGKVMMPLNNYGFSKQFGWTSDKFGISWQLNLQE